MAENEVIEKLPHEALDESHVDVRLVYIQTLPARAISLNFNPQACSRCYTTAHQV